MRSLAVFARRPEPGRVKTRLAPVLPGALACDLYRAMLEDALAAAAGCPADARYVYWAADDSPAGVDPLPSGFQPRIQHGADLGTRLERAFEELLADAGDRAVILGADCPALDAAALAAALETLERSAGVIGPARDGGYYLVGLARRAPELFRVIEWSTDRVLEQTLARARRLGLALTRLPEREDVDTSEDLVRWLRRAAAAPPAAQHASRALRAMGLLP